MLPGSGLICPSPLRSLNSLENTHFINVSFKVVGILDDLMRENLSRCGVSYFKFGYAVLGATILFGCARPITGIRVLALSCSLLIFRFGLFFVDL